MIEKPPRSYRRMNESKEDRGGFCSDGLFLFLGRLVLTELVSNLFDQAHFQIDIKGQLADKGKEAQIVLFPFPGRAVFKGVHGP